jgi:hypothetical protein
MIDENYEAKRLIFETLKSKGIVSGEYDDLIKSRMSPAEIEQLEADKKEMAHKADYADFKSKMSPEELKDYNQVFNEY